MIRAIVVFIGLFLLHSCTVEQTVKTDDEVLLYFKIYNQSGLRIDDSFQPNGNLPLRVIIGKGYVIDGMEKKLIGLKVGEKAEFEVSSEEAYGEAGVFYLDNRSDTVYLIGKDERLKIQVEILEINS